MALDAGSLRVTLQYAKDLKNCDWFGRQDPYVRLRVGSQDRRSRMCRDGGRNPVWDETFEFNIINENTLEMTLMDEDTLARDDLIGTCSVSLARVREHGRDVVQAPVSCGKNLHKQQGFVQVSLSFTPNSALRPPCQPLSAPYAMPPPAPYGYSYFPAPAPSFGPSPSGYYPAPSFHYSSSAQPPAVTGWPVSAPPAYGAPTYYPPPPASAQPYNGYYGGAPYRS